MIKSLRCIYLFLIFVFAMACNRKTSDIDKAIYENNSIDKSVKITDESDFVSNLYFIDSTNALNQISTTMLKNFLVNSEILDNGEYNLESYSIVDLVDDDGFDIKALRTKWLMVGSALKYNVALQIYETVSSTGANSYILASEENVETTNFCRCVSSCTTNGCDWSGNSTFCSCTNCFPSGDCKKENGQTTTSKPSKY